MWEWITATLDDVCRKSDTAVLSSSLETDDIKSEVCMVLLKDKELAKNIYERKDAAYLRKLVKRTVYELRAGMYFDNKQYFSRFQRIEFVCQKYGIEMLPENAYKISHMMEHENYCKEEFSIYHISKLLKEKKESETLLVYMKIGDDDDRNLSAIQE